MSQPTLRRCLLKRAFDLALAGAGLLAVGWLILLVAVLVRFQTGQPAFFRQERVGRGGRRFKLTKLRTMRSDSSIDTNVTSADDPRITKLGRLLRGTKIDELPQLWNILIGDMSFVGPRPDVPGYADELKGDDRIVLSVRPGLTGPATLKYRREEELLAGRSDPERYNREVIFPDKVRINREYVENWSFSGDLALLWKTVFGR